nr:hypothetical protein HUO10_006423 [Paraburkholderia busanensis]
MDHSFKEEMTGKLKSALDRVCDEKTFVEFLSQLSVDRMKEEEIEATTPSSPYSSGVLGWQNGSIDSFLDAASRWAEESRDGLQLYAVPDNPWKRAADILMMGKLYE